MRKSGWSKKKVVTGGVSVGGVTIGGSVSLPTTTVTSVRSRGTPIVTTPAYRTTTASRHIVGTTAPVVHTTHYGTGLHHHSTIGTRGVHLGGTVLGGPSLIGGTTIGGIHSSSMAGGSTSTFSETKTVNGHVVYDHKEMNVNGVKVQDKTYGANHHHYPTHGNMVASSLHNPTMSLQQPGMPLLNPNTSYVAAPDCLSEQSTQQLPGGTFLNGLISGPRTEAIVNDLDYNDPTTMNQCTMLERGIDMSITGGIDLNNLVSTLRSTKQTAETEAKLDRLLAMLEQQQKQSRDPVNFEKMPVNETEEKTSMADSTVSNDELALLIQQLQTQVESQSAVPAPETAAVERSVESNAEVIANLQAQLAAQQAQIAAPTAPTADSQAAKIAELQAQVAAQQEALQIAELQAQVAAQQELLRAAEKKLAKEEDEE